METDELPTPDLFLDRTKNIEYLEFLVNRFVDLGFLKKSAYFAQDEKQAIRELLVAYPFEDGFGPLPRQRAITLAAWFVNGNKAKKLPDVNKLLPKFVEWLDSSRDKNIDFTNGVPTDEFERFGSGWPNPSILKAVDSDKVAVIRETLATLFDSKGKSPEWKKLKQFSFHFKENTNFSLWLVNQNFPDAPTQPPVNLEKSIQLKAQDPDPWTSTVYLNAKEDVISALDEFAEQGGLPVGFGLKGSSWSVPGGVGYSAFRA